MSLMSYVKMPQPLLVLGGMYCIFAIFWIGIFLKDGYFSGILSGLANLVIRKYKFCIGFILVIILVIKFLDQPVTHLCKYMYNVNWYTGTDFISSMGEGWFLYGILFTISLILFALGYNKYGYLFRIALTTSIFAGVLNGVLKFIFNRERPSVGDDPWHFFYFFITGAKNPSNLLYAYNSMPSGHTISVVSALAVLYFYASKKFHKIILIVLGLLIMYSRVYTINHWFSDVLTSCIMGIMIGWVSYTKNKSRIIYE